MNNQQPNYQQQPYQQQPYQQPYQQQPYQQPYQPKPKTDIAGLASKITSILSFAFLIIAAVAFLYCFIMTIVVAASDKGSIDSLVGFVSEKSYSQTGFSKFLNGISWTVSTTAKYLLYSGILAALNKIAKK